MSTGPSPIQSSGAHNVGATNSDLAIALDAAFKPILNASPAERAQMINNVTNGTTNGSALLTDYSTPSMRATGEEIVFNAFTSPLDRGQRLFHAEALQSKFPSLDEIRNSPKIALQKLKSYQSDNLITNKDFIKICKDAANFKAAPNGSVADFFGIDSKLAKAVEKLLKNNIQDHIDTIKKNLGDVFLQPGKFDFIEDREQRMKNLKNYIPELKQYQKDNNISDRDFIKMCRKAVSHYDDSSSRLIGKTPLEDHLEKLLKEHGQVEVFSRKESHIASWVGPPPEEPPPPYTEKVPIHDDNMLQSVPQPDTAQFPSDQKTAPTEMQEPPSRSGTLDLQSTRLQEPPSPSSTFRSYQSQTESQQDVSERSPIFDNPLFEPSFHNPSESQQQVQESASQIHESRSLIDPSKINEISGQDSKKFQLGIIRIANSKMSFPEKLEHLKNYRDSENLGFELFNELVGFAFAQGSKVGVDPKNPIYRQLHNALLNNWL